MEDHRNWPRIGVLALVVALVYVLLLATVVRLTAHGLAPLMSAFAPITLMIRELLGAPSAKALVGLLFFCYWAFAFAVPLLPVLAVRQPATVKLALTAPPFCSASSSYCC